MTLALAWIVLPLLLAILATGSGLLLECVRGARLPGALVLPAGFALMLVVSSLMTTSASTAPFTTPLLVALAVAGIGLSLPLRRRPSAWTAGAAIAVYAVFAAPIVLSGSATFAGYISLDDTATWLAFADNALSHGHSLAALAPSTYEAVLHDNLSTGYPIGAMVPLGVGHQLTGQDAAWLFQPYIAFLASLLALSIAGLLSPLLSWPRLQAAVAFFAAQSALLFAYAFWSGIKEVTVAVVLALGSALAVAPARESARALMQLPLAIAVAALLAALGALGLVWLVVPAALGVALVGLNRLRRPALSVAVAVACALVLAVPAIADAWTFVRGAERGDSGNGALGNLLHPLRSVQVLGIWPVGDFRLHPAHVLVTYVVLGVLVAAAAFGIREAIRQGAWGVPLYALVALSGVVLVRTADGVGHGSPWLDGKALAAASPAPLVAGLTGAALLIARRRAIGIAALVVLAGGVVWSNALAYGSVWLAPRGQLAELESIGHRFAGDTPALMTEYQPYGVRHFLRGLDAEGASERRTRPVALRGGGVLDKAQYADLDAFDLGSVVVYRTLVLRTSPLESRPPSLYAPVRVGRWYEVWQRPLDPARIVDHLPLGVDGNPNGTPSCRDVRRLASEAERSGGSVVASIRPQPRVFDLGAFRRPPSWPAGAGGTVVPRDGGAAAETIELLHAGRFGFWVGGSFRDRLRLKVDGRPVAAMRHQLEETAQLTPLGSVSLSSGPHVVGLSYDGPGWRPGSRGQAFPVGPLVVGASAASARLVRVAPSRATSLCGRSLDWIEAVAAG
jgi:hypothetical protein